MFKNSLFIANWCLGACWKRNLLLATPSKMSESTLVEKNVLVAVIDLHPTEENQIL